MSEHTLGRIDQHILAVCLFGTGRTAMIASQYTDPP
jgi:hypothetical protein